MNNNKIDPGSPLLALQQQQILLRMEYEYEKEEFQRQTETMGIARKVKRGLCWYPVQTGRNYYNSLNQLVIEIIRTEDKDIEHAFEFGRPVCFFQQDYNGKIKYMNFTATVSFADEERMVVVLPGTSALLDVQNADYLGVQLYFDETSYRAMFNALEDVLRAKGNRLAELRDTLLGTLPIRRRELYPVRFPWLNSTQEEAVNKVLCAKDVAIVHGPPGTGKTTTLVEAIYETLHRENQVLVCAQSNTAVDWIAEKLVDRGVPVLRIGNPTRVNDKMLSFTYERRFENHPAYTELWSVRKSIREISGHIRKGNYSERESMRNRISRLRDRATELEILINEDLFSSARVIASTLVSSNHRILEGRRFSTLFIDEAAQALEAACWIAIRKADRVIFAGCFAIRTNCIEDPFECLAVYKQRQIVETAFRQMKVLNGNNRLRCTERTYVGKLLLFVIAQSLRMRMLYTVKENEQRLDLDLPGDSLDKAMAMLKGIMAIRPPSKAVWAGRPISKKARDILELLGINNKFPRNLKD